MGFKSPLGHRVKTGLVRPMVHTGTHARGYRGARGRPPGPLPARHRRDRDHEVPRVHPRASLIVKIDVPKTAVVHRPSVTNARIHLHQEYAMRTGGYDERARVESVRHGWIMPDGQPTCFHALVEELGVDAAVRDVAACGWLSESDMTSRGGPCLQCEEVARA